ncbi:MAG: sugar nucleotide-binding protein [Akkermansia sp.]
MKRELIIIGASGRTGSILAQEAQAQGFDCCCPTHVELPLEDADALSDFILAHPDAVALINCAAMSQLEHCLDDALQAHLVNALAPAQMALACRHTGARLIHLSTDYVLDGRRAGLKDESTKCRPCNTYGLSKREGEEQVMEANENAIIARVSWVCGNAQLPSFIEQSCNKAIKGEPLAAIKDKYSLPTHARDIAKACLALIDYPQARGLVQVCSGESEPLSWWDCAQKAMQELVAAGIISEGPVIAEQKLSEASFFRDERPRHTAMSNAKLTQQWAIPMMSADDTIKQAVADWIRGL